MEESIDYNELIAQISVNLNNALNTFGASSPQFQNVLSILKDCLRELDERSRKSTSVDPEMLNLAMGFLSLGE
ncbi:uncharacterized protein BO95DRAFT_459361 [Aspergillus brunneoviolaceus CBS 621.78]|uniref:Uncharacterized protein n=2 Tax=Aspergillus TaxID=5052 RepID=A0A8G1VYZ6_9EURO|nr:hypothetical protein BO95DRAFT_459361 [Aspergillus brunneoviolaceus CBS 621.78]XP_040800826.1 uncharacterized protein BO72DRAFT_496723 [Aspergillus fijiensis CBS 313.89]RAH50320.1 hypothetical protein BO95DRAFT_459361 [Aspergillus brunneoviolaceus CBS 621.78]RAK76816.1 hypothetical protein BO72DRAFT_496723 [Aspergillus fijiensis CBS 313.89]